MTQRRIPRMQTAAVLAAASMWCLSAVPANADPPGDVEPRGRALVQDPAALVNPFVGTLGNPDQPWGGQGHTTPAASVPFGMLMWGPDTTPVRPPGGYSYDSDRLTGFSLTHVDGPGCDGLAGDVPLLPVSGALPEDLTAASAPFSHDTETARPGAYSVTAGDVDVSLAAANRTGVGSFEFPTGAAAHLLVKTGGASQLGTEAASVSVDGDRRISGTVRPGKFCGGTPTYDLHFVIEFERPFDSFGTWSGTEVTVGGRAQDGDRSGAYVSFDPDDGPVRARVGISYVDADGARGNLAAEQDGWDPGALAADAHREWNRYLRRIEIGGGTRDEQRTFYSSLYRVLRHPNVFSDADGRYLGFDEQVHRVADGREFYTTFSGWDTYRTLHPLLALIAPDEASDMMQSMVDAARQSPTRSMPHWTVANHDGFVMPGDPSAAIIAETHALGADDFEADAALDLLIAQSDREHDYAGEPNASTVLENAAADFASARLAGRLGRPGDQQALLSKARSWVSRFDPATGFVRPVEDGLFARTFDPTQDVGMVEGTAHQYRWMVPFAQSGLINGIGGDAEVVAALDELFVDVNGGLDTPHAWMGNEPNLATPWMYNHAGAPWRTQDVVHRVRTELYSPDPDGLAGNDDLGSLTSWYVFAAIGLYPETMGTGDLALHNPLFPRVVVHRDAGDLRITAPRASATHRYLDGVRVDGRPHPDSWLARDRLVDGVRLDFQMASEPNREWAVAPEHRPPSSPEAQHPVAAGITPERETAIIDPRTTAGHQLTLAALDDGPVSGSWALDVPGLEVSRGEGRFDFRDDRRRSATRVEVGGDTEGVFPGMLRVTTDDGRSWQRPLLFRVGELPELPTGVFDDFERYQNDASLRSAYRYNNARPEDVTLTQAIAPAGERAVEFGYDFTRRDYGGFGRVFDALDWSGFEQVSAWLTPDGSDQKLVLQLKAGGVTFEAYPSLAGTETTQLQIPLTDFRDRENPTVAPTRQQLASVTEFFVYLNRVGEGSTGSIVLDDIHAE